MKLILIRNLNLGQYHLRLVGIPGKKILVGIPVPKHSLANTVAVLHVVEW